MDETAEKHKIADYNSGPMVGITFSTFDLLHIGHIMTHAHAKGQYKCLNIGLQLDQSLYRPEKNAPTQTDLGSYIQLHGCRFVEEIVSNSTEQDIEDILRTFKIATRIIGYKYANRDFTSHKYCDQKSKVLYFNSRDYCFSSSSLRKIVALKESRKHHNITT